jgi:hypothetical protein
VANAVCATTAAAAMKPLNSDDDGRLNMWTSLVSLVSST